MEKEYLHKLKEIKRVETPDFLLEIIVSKIDSEEVNENKKFSYSLAFAVALVFINVSIISNYLNTDTNSSSQEITNPYSFSTYTLIENE
ncbi:hypothetical protein N9P55_00495 [bacterium]|nr:hypothetical protein [bacterium]MDB4088984.1 hypothetical protein [Flavobacteriales bacterium]